MTAIIDRKTVKKRLPEYLLLPFAVLYGIAVFVRNKLFDWQILRSHEFDLPVISVGNITAGGTGKTPHTEYLTQLLKDDYRVAVLSRGYKRITKGFVLAGPESTPGDIGDEACQIKSKFPDILVAVDEKRVRGIRKLLEMNAEVILLDDAFQHRYVKPGLSVLLIDFDRPVTKDYLLPFGRLREPVSSASRANIILITKSPDDLKAIDMRVRVKDFKLNPFQHLYYTGVKGEEPEPVFSTGVKSEFLWDQTEVLMVCGIARAGNVLKIIGKPASDVRQICFPDHHPYMKKDIEKIISTFRDMPGINKVILTTEKDAVKLRMFQTELSEVSGALFYIPIKVHFLNNDTENFNSQITSYVRSNKRNSILHQGKNQMPA